MEVEVVALGAQNVFLSNSGLVLRMKYLHIFTSRSDSLLTPLR